MMDRIRVRVEDRVREYIILEKRKRKVKLTIKLDWGS